MKICSNCNKEFDDEFNFCPFCGTQYGKIECPNCHKLLNKASPFCGYCGHKLINNKELDTKGNIKEELDNNKINLPKIYNSIIKIFLIIMSTLFLIAIFCPYYKMYIQQDIYNLPITGNISIFSFFTNDYFEFINQKSDFHSLILFDSIINLIVITIGIIFTVSFSIFSIIKNSISLAKGDKEINYSFTVTSGTFYFITIFISIFCTLGFANEKIPNQMNMSCYLGIFPIILIIISCLFIVSNFVLKFCLIDKKFNIKSLIIRLSSTISYIFNIIIVILLLGSLITIKNSNGEANIPAFLSLMTMQSLSASISQSCLNKLILCYTFNLLIIILSIINLSFSLRTKEKFTLTSLVFSSVIAFFNILLIIITGITITELCQYIAQGSKIYVSSNIIASLVLQFITLGFVITKFVLLKKEN